MLSSLLLSAGQQRPLWREVGVGLVAVDTLVHNFLLRTGILRRLGADHPYGVRCYRTGGCADIRTRFAASIDARVHPTFPQQLLALEFCADFSRHCAPSPCRWCSRMRSRAS